jgi:SAM-dependent methyltransferase
MDAFAAPRRNTDIDAINGAFYRTSLVMRGAPKEGLDAQETITLLKYQRHLVGRDVLDIGVGAGRTTRVLAPLARDYVAIDYSPIVVEAARKAMPDVEILLADMRDLSRWSDGTIDFVFGPNNVLDAVSHADRERTLRELRRVLRDDGLLAFSSHNRCYERAGKGPWLRRSRNPVALAFHLVRYLASLRLYRLNKDLTYREDDYALIVECGPDHALLHYYVDRNAQERQLKATGFKVVEVLDRSGQPMPQGEMSPESSSLMYVARKA